MFTIRNRSCLCTDQLAMDQSNEFVSLFPDVSLYFKIIIDNLDIQVVSDLSLTVKIHVKEAVSRMMNESTDDVIGGGVAVGNAVVEVVVSDDDDGASLAARRGSDDEMEASGSQPGTSSGLVLTRPKRCRAGQQRQQQSAQPSSTGAAAAAPAAGAPSTSRDRNPENDDDDDDEQDEAGRDASATIRFRLLGKHDRHQR